MPKGKIENNLPSKYAPFYRGYYKGYDSESMDKKVRKIKRETEKLLKEMEQTKLSDF
jgi:thiaminase